MTEVRNWAAEAAEHRAASEASHRRSAESFERSDTDGFLSQYCSDLTGRLERRLAEICDNEGRDTFKGLYDGDRRVAARMMTFANKFAGYGTVTKWLLHDDEAERYGRKWIPVGKRSRIQKELGLSERWELAPAWAKVMGSGTGLSGLASCYIGSFRTGDKWGRDAELVEDDE